MGSDINGTHHGEGFAQALARDLEGLCGQRRFVEQRLASTGLFFPIAPVVRATAKLRHRAHVEGSRHTGLGALGGGSTKMIARL
jgi:hypothetical protein